LRFSFYSLRTGIVTYLAFLLLCAMLLINVVMVKFQERDLIQAGIRTGRVLTHALEQMVGYELETGERAWPRGISGPAFEKALASLVRAAGFKEALVLNREGTRALRTGTGVGAEEGELSLARQALASREWSVDFYGTTWAVIWLAHRGVTLSAPLFFRGRLVGAAAMKMDLRPLYSTMRKTEKVILLYIGLNTILLVLFGIYLLSRTVVKPIHRLLRITEEFKGGEPFPRLGEPPREEMGNEIGRLFHSLNMMLKRLDENKEALKSHISSLKKANEELKKAQDEVVRSEKWASVGRLATGVAHEIGNPIGIILGYLELLKRTDLKGEEKQDFLDRIESEITRISKIIRQLLDFSRPEGGEEEETGVHDLIMETINMLNPQPMMAHIRVETSFKASADRVWANPNQLKQVFLNVIMNAADAMGEQAGPGHTGVLNIETLSQGDFIEIRFADNGPGISPEQLPRVFDPFYTTKEPGKGTGLGLSVCYRIIEGLGGAIRVESSPGEGTIVIIDIPGQVKT